MRSAEPLHGQTQARQYHGQRAERQGGHGPAAHGCFVLNYRVGAKVHVWPRNGCLRQSRLSEEVPCLRQPRQLEGC